VEICNSIDEDTIELDAMGRLENGFIRTHLRACHTCRERVSEHRAWIECLKASLRKLEAVGESRDRSRGSSDSSPEQGP
jgi:uncharacterized protein YlaI